MTMWRQIMPVTVALALFWVAFVAAAYVHFYPGPLSTEASEYSKVVAEVHSGISLFVPLQKICFCIGVGSLFLGSALIPLRNRLGPILFSSAALPLAATIPLGEPYSYFPDIENALAGFLLCSASALWGIAATLAWGSYCLQKEAGDGTEA